MRKEDERLIIEHAPPTSLLALLATLGPLDEEFPSSPTRLPMRYLLDTNIVSDLVGNPRGHRDAIFGSRSTRIIYGRVGHLVRAIGAISRLFPAYGNFSRFSGPEIPRCDTGDVRSRLP